ncbi:MAG: pyruvate formate lyase family protein [Candidatus Latescibacterota bacterium]
MRDGVAQQIAHLEKLMAATTDPKSGEFYQAALILWNAVLGWNDQHVQALAARAAGAAGAEAARLARLLEVCGRVPRHPARTFHEALQSFYFVHLAVIFEDPDCGNCPGRLDHLLWPYLERDLAAGRTTLEEAKELIDELFIRFEERLHGEDLCVEAIMAGGIGPDGASAVNPLSHILVNSIGALDQPHPAVYTRLCRDGPEAFLDLCVRYLLHGQNRAQVFNDEACVPAIVQSGAPVQEAAMYMAGGCMEISVQGMNCDLNFAATHNVAKTLELVLNGGRDLRTGERRLAHDRDLTDYRGIEDLYAALRAELERCYGELVRALDIASQCYAEYRPRYLASTMIGDCAERGREQQDGGARYHDYGFAPLGITSAADSLHAIQQAVYDQGFVSAAELLAALRANYVGFQPLRQRLDRIPKYGVDDPGADAVCNSVLQMVCAAAAGQRTRFGGKLKPMIFNFVWTPGASRELGALADGTPAGAPIGHGLTPRSRAMTAGLTAAMNSATSVRHGAVAGGATTMWDVDEEWVDFALMKALLKTFCARGGMIFQGNTTGVAPLEEALEHPDRHANLIVRVGGFSARFVGLDRDLQHEIIARRRHRR